MSSSQRCVPAMSDNHEIRYLLRYFSFLSCAEMIGSQLKATVKRKLTEPNLRLKMDDHAKSATSGHTLHAHRRSILETELKSATDALNQQMCENFLSHFMSYISRCLRQEDTFYWFLLHWFWIFYVIIFSLFCFVCLFVCLVYVWIYIVRK